MWRETSDGTKVIDQSHLLNQPESLVVLGEAGMGKTQLLRWLGAQPGYAYCTARQLINARPTPQRLLGSASTLVVDALDELTARADGDAVDLVLQKLGDLGYPRFVLSCRVADWRNATGLSSIQEQYGEAMPLVLHLQPLNEQEIHRILVDELGGDVVHAERVAAHFEDADLGGMLSNPQTLEMAATVAKAGALPSTKSQLFERAVDLLRKEHRDSKADLQADEMTTLDAAGAAFAALILTGSEALVVDTAEPDDHEMPLREVAALPSASELNQVLGSRLFGTVGAPNRFSYWHRRIGEFLGARWLARQARTASGRRRILALFHSYAVVPASLRGLHAWLAYHAPALAPAAIATDPMGVIEYGDADALSIEHGNHLLDALEKLATQNPRALLGQRYRLKSIAQPAIVERVRALAFHRDTPDELTYLLVQAIKGSSIAQDVREDLRRLALDVEAAGATRRAAVEVLVGLGGEAWPSLVNSMRMSEEEDPGFVLWVIQEIGAVGFDPAHIVELAIKRARQEDRGIGTLRRLSGTLPPELLDGVLDQLAAQAPLLGNRHERGGNDEITDLAYSLIARRLNLGSLDPLVVWRWLVPFEKSVGYRKESREEVHTYLRNNTELRRAIQRFVLFDEVSDKNVWDRSWRLSSRSSGLSPTSEDVVVLLGLLDSSDSSDSRWRDVMRLTHHSEDHGAEVRSVAKRFVANRPDMQAWIDSLAQVQEEAWQIRQRNEQRHRIAKRAIERQEVRQFFGQNVDALRKGTLDFVRDPALTYLSFFDGLSEATTPIERLVDWLGDELKEVACQGFEAFLQSSQAPTAEQVIESHAASKLLAGAKVIVAALAERIRTARGLADVPPDQLTVGFYTLRNEGLEEHAGLDGLQSAVENEMRRRDLFEGALKAWIEPQLVAKLKFVEQLSVVLWSDLPPGKATAWALDWLTRIPDVPLEVEAQLMDRLAASGCVLELRALAAARLSKSLDEDKRRNWVAIAFVVDFHSYRELAVAEVASDASWIWAVRRWVVNDHGRPISLPLAVEQLSTLLAMLRGAYPAVARPSGVTSGRTNPWNASEFVRVLANRLAEMASDDAGIALRELSNAPSDGYSDYFRTIAAEQRRKHTETLYQPPLLSQLRAIAESQPPQTVVDLQATLLEHLEGIQKRIYADPADPWRGFFSDTGIPHDEERCRDHLLTMLGVRPESISLSPEGHLADDNRADVMAEIGALRLPIEIKGQWHSDVWHAADTQLDRLYASDYGADRRGIYLVFWFGQGVPENKAPRSSARGKRRPSSPAELRSGLVESSHAARSGRVHVVVLNLERPQPS